MRAGCWLLLGRVLVDATARPEQGAGHLSTQCHGVGTTIYEPVAGFEGLDLLVVFITRREQVVFGTQSTPEAKQQLAARKQHIGDCVTHEIQASSNTHLRSGINAGTWNAAQKTDGSRRRPAVQYCSWSTQIAAIMATPKQPCCYNIWQCTQGGCAFNPDGTPI